MDLREYLFRNRLTVTELSKKLECHRTYLSEIVNGARKPGKRLAKDIERATDGQVTADELLKEKEDTA